MLFGYAEGKSNCTDLEHRPRAMLTAILYRRIKPGLFPSLCIGEINRTILEFCVHLQEATAKFPDVDSSNKTLRRRNQMKRQSWIDNVSIVVLEYRKMIQKFNDALLIIPSLRLIKMDLNSKKWILTARNGS